MNMRATSSVGTDICGKPEISLLCPIQSSRQSNSASLGVLGLLELRSLGLTSLQPRRSLPFGFGFGFAQLCLLGFNWNE